MNPNGQQPMKQDIEYLTETISEMTIYKPDRPTDLFQFYHPQIRKHFVDAYNLSRLWLENFLYWKGLYPQEAFDTKTAYACKVFVFLDNFFQSVCQNFQFVEFIEIQMYEYNQSNNKILVEKERFYFSFTDKFANTENVQQIKSKGLNTIQKEIEFKRFLGKMEEELKKGIKCRQDNDKRSYRLFLGYKWDHKSKNNKHRMNLLQKWTQIEPAKQNLFTKNVINHAGTGQLELICQRYTPLRQQGNKIHVQ